MFMSVISLIVAIEHGRTMQRMADANTRMVAANSWPFVLFETHNVDERGNAVVRLVLTNEGIGPARVETFELWWNGKPMSSPEALMQACCRSIAAASQQAKATMPGVRIAAPRILRAGEHVDFYTLAANPQNEGLFSKFDDERDKITTRVCYCSVFDECWVHLDGGGFHGQDKNNKMTHPDRVDSCPVPARPFNPI